MSGWIILDKSSGLFSRSASSRVARLFGYKKSGHIGTLDPMATGVLPIAIGDATKMIPFVESANDGTKEYLFSCKFGISTDSLDITGTITQQNNKIPTDTQINDSVTHFIGDVMQVPPIYSAVHVDGVRAYKIARNGENIDIAPRKIHIFDLRYDGFDGENWNFYVKCGRGTYVRSLARDIANYCKTIATVTAIRRISTNGFDLKNAVTLDFLENMVKMYGDINEFLMPIDLGLGGIPVLNLDDKDTELYRHGGFIKTTEPDGLVRVYNDDTLVGIGFVQDKQLRPKRTI